MKIEEIVKRRAKMDFKMDIQSGELWGEDEIVNCIDEITEKIKQTLKTFLKMTNNDELKFQIENALYGNDEKTLYLIEVWQEQYRLEKMIYILERNDSRNKEVA